MPASIIKRVLLGGLFAGVCGVVALAGFRSIAGSADLTCRDFMHGVYTRDPSIQRRMMSIIEPATRVMEEPTMMIAFIGAKCQQNPDATVKDIAAPMMQYIADHTQH